MEHVGLPSTQFADYAKIARPTISQLLNGRNRKVSNELIGKLHEAFPDLNIMWLMFGDGEMEIKKTAKAEPFHQPTLFSTQPDDASSTEKQVETLSGKSSKKDSANRPIAEEQTNTIQIPITQSNGTMHKKIQTIMVCYTDNSFEIFTPAKY